KLKEAGADGVKLLLYYNPFDEASLNEGKKAFVQRVGAECAHQDIPFFLEFVGYDPSGQASPLEYARKKPEIVTQSMREFSRDLYQVDVLKVEIPVNLQYTSGTSSFQGPQAAYSREEAKELYRKAAGAARRPFIYLSGGVDDQEFREGLAMGIEAKVHFSGVLCGRATWKDGIAVYAGQGLSALEDWLGDRGIQNIQALNEILAEAHSWQDFS
ncbi:MAG: tagatose 1,6-diphosphate aldolase, partial [Acidobacteria bacterium]|nr:tagatose 1,6-diphosphate aldolase [Acidobacteriota bacterium]